jgi:hypothetical protein
MSAMPHRNLMEKAVEWLMAHGKPFATFSGFLYSLSTDIYRAQPGESGGFILKHSVGSVPHNGEVDVPLTYADYYFIEALLRYKKWYLS